MNVLLCLLSDQHIPNLLSVRHYAPDQLVLLQTPQMHNRGVADHFLAALSRGGCDYASRCHVQRSPATVDLTQIRAALQAAYGRFPSAAWIANVTGGTKPMSIAAYEFFKAVGGKIVYTDLSQPNTILDLATGVAEPFGHRPSVEEFVTGYGFRLQKPAAELQAAKDRATQPLWRDTAVRLAAHASGHDVVEIDDSQWDTFRKKGGELPADKFLFPDADLHSGWLGSAASRKLDKYEGEFLTGGWLEVFFYNLFSRHADALAIWDVALGQNFSRDVGPGQVPNDIDVSFMHNHGLATVECKSGTQEHDLSRGMDTLYKVEAVARQLRALRVRSFLVTTGQNVLDKAGKLRSGLESRAELYNCTILLREQISELAALEWANSPEVAARVKQCFRL